MPGGLVREVFFKDTTWTAPAGVTQITVKKIPSIANTINNTTSSPGGTKRMLAVNCCCDAYGWGDNTCGALGINNITVQCLPQPICCGLTFKKIAQGFQSYVLGLDMNGALYGWGDNTCGGLGINSITVQCQPQPVCCGLTWKDISVDNTDFSAYGITTDGDLYAWGDNSVGNLGINSITVQCKPQPVCCGLKWICVQAANTTVMGLTCTNDLYAWGANTNGVLGIGSTTNQCKPQPVCCGLKVASFSLIAEGRAYVVTTSNTGYAWGVGSCGVLGINSITNQCQPQPICCGLAIKAIYSYAGGSSSNAFLVTTGNSLYAWGKNVCGALGINSITAQCQPQPVCCALSVDSVTAGNFLSSLVTNTGCMYSWGIDTCGVLGLNTITVQCQPQPVCCAFSWFVPAPSSEVVKSFSVTPGFVYTVQVNGPFQGFGQSANVSQDVFAQAVIIEYFA